MKTVNRYLDEISGKEFKTREEAIKSEKKNGGIKKLFEFWDDDVDFDCNNDKCFQRSDVDYLRLQDALIKAIEEYEPWIAKHYQAAGGLQRRHMKSGLIIGRFLSDSAPELYHWYCQLSNLLENWDENYGGEDPTETTKEMEIECKKFVENMKKLYQPYQCEIIHSEAINVNDWVKKNAPHWINGEGNDQTR